MSYPEAIIASAACFSGMGTILGAIALLKRKNKNSKGPNPFDSGKFVKHEVLNEKLKDFMLRDTCGEVQKRIESLVASGLALMQAEAKASREEFLKLAELYLKEVRKQVGMLYEEAKKQSGVG